MNSTFLRGIFSSHFHFEHYYYVGRDYDGRWSIVNGDRRSVNGQRYYSYPIHHWPLKFLSTYSPFTMYSVKIHRGQCILYLVLSCIYLFSMSVKWTMDSPKHIDSKITIIRSLSQNRFYPHIRSSQFVYSVYWNDRSNATPNHTNFTLKTNQFNWNKFKRFVVVLVSTRFFWYKCH